MFVHNCSLNATTLLIPTVQSDFNCTQSAKFSQFYYNIYDIYMILYDIYGFYVTSLTKSGGTPDFFKYFSNLCHSGVGD